MRKRRPAKGSVEEPASRDQDGPERPPAAAVNRVPEAVDAAFYLSALVENSEDAIVSKTLDGIITSWNKGAEGLFGYTADEAVGQPATILLPPERADEELRILSEIAKGERIAPYETVRRRKDGCHIDVSVAVSPIKDASGKVIGASKIARDISEQRLHLDLLQRSEERYRVTLASVGDAVVSTDAQGRVTFMNPVAEKLTGWSLSEAVGQPLETSFRIVNERDRQRVESPVDRVLRSGLVVGLANSTLLIAKDGTERAIDDSAAPIRTTAGELIGVVLVFRDITERRRAEAESRRLEALRTGTLSAALDAIITIDQATEILEFNPAAERMFGYARDNVLGKRIGDLIVPPSQREAHIRGVARYLETGEARILGRRLELDGMRSDGSEFPCELTVVRVPVEGPPQFTAFVRDISERRQRQASLVESEERFRTLANNIAQMAWMADDKGHRFWFNRRWHEYTGAALDDVVGWGWTTFHHPDHVDRVRALVERSLETGEPWEDTYPLRGKDGTYRWFFTQVAPMRDAGGKVVRWLGTNTDVTERHAAEEALRHGALHDALTDLPNRAYFVERVSQALARVRRDPDQRFAVMLLDCDGFKAVNDTLGHAVGDGVLTEMAARLRNCVRPGDVVARLGGDEFTLLLEEVAGVPDAEAAARRILGSFVAPLALDGREIVATVSIGAVLSEPYYEQPQELLRDADVAMYHAKQQGGARFQLFDAALRDSARARVDMESDLRNALARREFRVMYLPIVELETGRVRAVEALMRWHRGKRTLVAPRDFMALAEQSGLIVPIGGWVVEEACRAARSWENLFPAAAPVHMSVNLSAEQLRHPDLAERLRATLHETGIAPTSLTLEIAEQVLMEDIERSKTVVGSLRELGADVFMDDFGAGHSPLVTLPLLPLQGVKLDRPLVHRMGTRRTDLEVVHSMVDLAKSLGLTVVAEGIETVAQRERLIAFGCELGQGHLFTEALDPDSARDLLAGSARLGHRGA